MKILKVIKTEDLKQYQKLMRQKSFFYCAFILFWIGTIIMNKDIIGIIHDAMFMSTAVLIMGLYFTHHKMKEMLQ